MLIIKNTELNGKSVDILIDGGRISRISGEIRSDEYKDARIINGASTAAVPSFFNAHTHTPMVLLRGYGDDMLLDSWLRERIWPVESRLSDEDFYRGYRLGLLEMIKSGTGCFNEMYMNPEIELKLLEEFPLKAYLNYPILDGLNEDISRKQIADCLEFFGKNSAPDGVKFGLAAHSVGANSIYSLKWIRDYSGENNLNVHIHLSETENDVERCRAAHDGLSPVELLDSIGFLNERLFAAHTVWLSEKDMDILADRGVSVIHNPVSNMKLATGRTFPYKQLKSRGVKVFLGTDGAASNNNLDMFEEMNVAALLQKHEQRDPSVMSAEEIFSIATAGRTLKEGADADFMLVDLDADGMQPSTNLISNLVYSANGNTVKTLVCGGRMLMEDRAVANEDEIKRQASECAAKLLKLRNE